MDENHAPDHFQAAIRLHATTVARDGFAALLRGSSGAGKSDLALRFLALVAAFPPTMLGQHALVADDQTIVALDGQCLTVSCPATISGRIEVRGIGIVPCPAATSAKLVLVVDLVTPADVHRLPDDCTETILGIGVARIALAPFEPSAPLKLALALDRARLGLPPA